MWSNDEIINYLKENLKEGRFNHTLGVAETAKTLAKLNNVDEKRAELGALLHDCAKNMMVSELIRILEENSQEIDEIEKRVPELLHAKVGAIVARETMGIEDEEVLSSVVYHTTGKKNMTTLEKIIFIADYIEPNRVFPGVEETRILTFKDLDKGVLAAIDNSLKFIITNGGLVHPYTIEARNFLLMEQRK